MELNEELAHQAPIDSRGLLKRLHCLYMALWLLIGLKTSPGLPSSPNWNRRWIGPNPPGPRREGESSQLCKKNNKNKPRLPLKDKGRFLQLLRGGSQYITALPAPYLVTLNSSVCTIKRSRGSRSLGKLGEPSPGFTGQRLDVSFAVTKNGGFVEGAGGELRKSIGTDGLNLPGFSWSRGLNCDDFWWRIFPKYRRTGWARRRAGFSKGRPKDT